MDTRILTPPIPAAAFPIAPAACANCDTPRMGEYCYGCGQHFLEGRLTISRLVRDFLVRRLSLEGGLVRTVVDLTIRPDAMIRDYVNGRRQRYTNPVGYLMMTAALYVLLNRFWAGAMEAGMRAENDGLDAAVAEGLIQVQMYVEGHPALMTLLLCLFLVPSLRLLFFDTTNTAEAAVFALFVSAQLTLMQVVINIAALLLSAEPYSVMTGPITYVPMLLLLFVAGQFFGTRFSSLFRFAMSLAVALFGFLVLFLLAWLVVAVLSGAAPVPAPA